MVIINEAPLKRMDLDEDVLEEKRGMMGLC